MCVVEKKLKMLAHALLLPKRSSLSKTKFLVHIVQTRGGGQEMCVCLIHTFQDFHLNRELTVDF